MWRNKCIAAKLQSVTVMSLQLEKLPPYATVVNVVMYDPEESKSVACCSAGGRWKVDFIAIINHNAVMNYQVLPVDVNPNDPQS